MIRQTLNIATRQAKEIIDITDQLNHWLKESKLESGQLHLWVLHTTVALTAACLDPGTDQDMLDAWQIMIPKLSFRHPHNPDHAPDHILSALIGPSLTVPVKAGQLMLGSWQRIILCEFDGPKKRQVAMTWLE